MNVNLLDRTRKAVALAGFSAALALTGGMAQANTVNSNQPDCTGDPIARVFTVTATTVVKCLAKGSGNINGNGDAINNLGYLLLDKSDTSGGLVDGALSATTGSLGAGLTGTVGILASVYTNYSDIVIAFKSGDAQIDPVWAAFLLAANTVSVDWTISGQQALSHVNLYGKLKNGGPPGGNTPEPASLALVGLALAAAGFTAKRRRMN